MSNVTTLLADLRRNGLINGDFRVDQRYASTSSAKNSGTNGFTGYVMDRWHFTDDHSSNTWSMWREAFTLGQADVPGNPLYHLRWQNAAPSGGSVMRVEQRIESVRSYQGKRVGVGFYAKADSAVSVNVSFLQHFGTSGSPSGDVAIAAQTITMSTSWQRFELLFDIPGVGGKTLGTDKNDYLALRFSLPVNTALIFDLATVGVTVDTVQPFSYRGVEFADEIRLMQRFCFKTYDLETPVGTVTTIGSLEGQAASASSVTIPVQFPSVMRAIPTVTVYNPHTGSSGSIDEALGTSRTAQAVRIGVSSCLMVNAGGVTDGTRIYGHCISDAEL